MVAGQVRFLPMLLNQILDMEKFQKATHIVSEHPVGEKYFKEETQEEVYVNDVYQVNVRRGIPLTNDENVKMTHLSVKRLDKGHQMDWRHMQLIKNELVGEENEGMEMFPAESRLVDGANQFHIWVFENPEMRFPWGFQQRLVTDDDSIGNVQREFEHVPEDLAENNKRYRELLKKYQDGEIGIE